MERFKRDLNYKDHQRCLLIEKWRDPTPLLLKYRQMTVLSFSFYRGGEDYFGYPSGYSKHTITKIFHMAAAYYIILLNQL